MRMVPTHPYETGSQAEKWVFDRLRRSFDDRYIAYHSLRPTSHPYKRFSEIDFLICCPDGLYVLEVKGGRVACRDGLWTIRNRFGQTTHSQEGPFRQAESALHGLMKKLRDELPERILAQVTIGFGVILPDVYGHDLGVEIDPAMVADKHSCYNLDGWLRNLFKHWREQARSYGEANADVLRKIQAHLRPDVDLPTDETGSPLNHRVEEIGRHIEQLTDDQMRMVDVAAANPRVLCAGGAGTGKTFLAERLARHWADSGMQVALVCRSAWLRHFLDSRLAIPGLAVSSIEGVGLELRRLGLRKFDALIVDEGQDLLENNYMETLDSILAGGFESGRWSWFQDLNNQSLTDGYDPSVAAYLEGLDSVRMPLRSNCRNTGVIVEWIQNTLGADLGVGGAGAGPEVRRYAARDEGESAERLATEISELIDVGGLSPGAVTILSPFDFAESSLALMPKATRGLIRRLDEYSMRKTRGNKIGFARIQDFKGLENEAIIVIDLPAPNKSVHKPALHYVAMSRARSVLSLVEARYGNG